MRNLHADPEPPRWAPLIDAFCGAPPIWDLARALAGTIFTATTAAAVDPSTGRPATSIAAVRARMHAGVGVGERDDDVRKEGARDDGGGG